MTGDSTPHAPKPSPARVLVVDDDAIVRETIGEALGDAGYDVTLAGSGDEALDRLRSEVYHLVFSDIVMPKMSGIELCGRINALLPHLPIVLITGYGTVDVAREGLDVGAADFVSKPINLAELPIVVERNLQRQRLEAQRAHHRAAAVMLQAVEALVQALDVRDDSTAQHSQRVSSMAVAVGRYLGMEEDQIYALRLAGLLHDVGKIGVRDNVLLKPGSLDHSETALMEVHPVKGAEILANIEDLSEVVSGVLHHHENYDGTGYPDQLVGDAIPLLSRIIRVVDSWDAMVTSRPYREGLTPREASQRLIDGARRQFDPHIVSIFLESVVDSNLSG